MGGVCSRGTVKRPSAIKEKSVGFPGKLNTKNSFGKKSEDPYLHSGGEAFDRRQKWEEFGDMRLQFSSELKPDTPARSVANKVPQVSSFLGRAGVVGLERAVEVLDTLGSSMSNLNANSGFISGITFKGNKVCILAFEVANTVVKGSNLLQSVNEESIQYLKKEILHSEAVQQLVSTDMNELLCIAAADKREEFNVFSREVIRFGNLCKDPQWHNLGRFFSKLDTDQTTQKQSREEAELITQELNTLAHNTSELYHELQALDRFEQDYQRKIEEMESLHLPLKGESFMMLQSELKHQRKLVKSLKKKSLWSKNLGEVLEKLVDVITFIHQEILEAFGNNGATLVSEEVSDDHRTLGRAGLALHYANIINQIDNIASRPTCLPSNMRDSLYNALPSTVKGALRSRLQTDDTKEELTVPQIKAEMEKTLQWLAPVAANTTKAHQGFGWVGEWANSGAEFGKKTAAKNNLIRLETLYHANIQKTDSYILEQMVWLHRLISLIKQKDGAHKPRALRSPPCRGLPLNSRARGLRSNILRNGVRTIQLSEEDRSMLEGVEWRRTILRRSKSQGSAMAESARTEVNVSSRSTGSSPIRGEKSKASELKCPGDVLDIIDGLNTAYSKGSWGRAPSAIPISRRSF